MTYGAVTYKLPRTSNYDLAKRRWEQSRKPRSAIWQEHQRPLYNNRSTHYRIERGEQGGQTYYDIVHHHTALARFYEPVDGFERRLYRGWDSMSSRGVMDNVLGIRWSRKTPYIRRYDLDGVEHYVPIGYKAAWYEGVGSVDLYVRLIDGRFDLQCSRHAPWVRKVMSAEEKRRRAQIREQVRPWVALMHTQVNDWVQAAERDYANGKHRLHIPRVGGTHSVPWLHMHHLVTFFYNLATGHTHDHIDAGGAIREVLRLYVMNKVLYASKYEYATPTFDDWHRAATRVLLSYADNVLTAKRNRDSVDMQQFPTTGKPWPRSAVET